MSGPAEDVRPTDVSPESPDGGAFRTACAEATRAEGELSESDSESTVAGTCTMSQGLDSWSMADASWSPTDLRSDGERSPASPVKRAASQARRPSVVREEDGEGEGAPGGAAPDCGAEPALPFRAPPGLAAPAEPAPAAQPPSRGSGTHRSGDCSPCVWHWKPQGCFRGAECGYCHLCPEGEIKTRKKAKLATLRTGSRGLLEADEKEQPPQGEGTPKEGAQRMPSVGSALHGTGECRPCAWFWKPQGCQNSQECRHCHLCPEGEIKLRKKLKAETLRRDQEEEEEEEEEEPEEPQGAGAEGARVEERKGAREVPEDPREPRKVVTRDIPADAPRAIPPPPGLAEPAVLKVPSLGVAEERPASVGSALHGSGECRPCAWFWKPQGCQNGSECRHCHLCPEGEIKARKRDKAETLRQEKLEPEEALAEPLLCVSPAHPLLCLPLLPPAPLPSIGSSLHGTGLCRPCAWFWKPQGCENGRECCHCHLCPSGEIKARRKMKVAVLRHQGSFQEQLEMQQEELGQWGAQWQAQQHAAVGFCLDREAASAETTPASEASPSPPADSQCGQSPFMLPVPLDLAASLDSPLPSTGSALHASGKCRPCAWFWKEKGCLNGQACAHCHLCPEGELKNRKKVKETAMRIGALMPARHNIDSRSPRIVKIAPVLGA